MIADNRDMLIDQFLNLNMSEKEKLKWYYRIEKNRLGFDQKSFLKNGLNFVEDFITYKDNLETILMALQSSKRSEEDRLFSFFNNTEELSTQKIKKLCDEIGKKQPIDGLLENGNYKRLEKLAVHINDYEKIFGDYYFMKVYMKNNPEVSSLLGKPLRQVNTYEQILEISVEEKIKERKKKGQYKNMEPEYRDKAENLDRKQDRGSITRTCKKNFRFMQSGLGLTAIQESNDIEKLNDDDRKTSLDILQFLIQLCNHNNRILSKLKKPVLGKKEHALGQKSALNKAKKQSNNISAHFDFIRRKLMMNLSPEELESLTLLAICFDYNRVYLQEVMRDFIDDFAEKIMQLYNAKFRSIDILAKNDKTTHEKSYQIDNTLILCFRAECVKVLKGEIKRLLTEVLGKEVEKRPYRHIAYLHSIGICGFSYTNEYDVYQECFTKQSARWKIKKWMTCEERSKIGSGLCKKWEYQWDDDSLELLLPKEKVTLPLPTDNNFQKLNKFIQQLPKNKADSNVLSLTKNVKEYLGINSVYKVNQRPDIYLLLALLANYVVHGKQYKPLDAEMLALCVFYREKVIQTKLKIREPQYHGKGETDRKSKKITTLLRSKGMIKNTPTFYLTTIGYMIAQVMDGYYQHTSLAEEYMDWLEIKRDLSNLLVNGTIIKKCTLTGIIEKRAHIFEFLTDKVTNNMDFILNDVRDKYIINN